MSKNNQSSVDWQTQLDNDLDFLYKERDCKENGFKVKVQEAFTENVLPVEKREYDLGYNNIMAQFDAMIEGLKL